jgi:hypothetical protein
MSGEVSSNPDKGDDEMNRHCLSSQVLPSALNAPAAGVLIVPAIAFVAYLSAPSALAAMGWMAERDHVVVSTGARVVLRIHSQ